MKSGDCEFCNRPGQERVAAGEGVEKPVYVCDSCWKLLKDPRTALPLLRGNLTLGLRGKMEEGHLKRMTNHFFEVISVWKPRD